MHKTDIDYSIKIRYSRMRKSMFLALSDVIDTFVVAEKQHKKKEFYPLELILQFH